jgi:hypothetical protein
MNNEQKLIDIMFQCIMMIRDGQYKKYFETMNNDEIAAWVRNQLDNNGFYTEPMGLSWGVLTKKKTKQDFNKIEIVNAERFE